MIVLVMLLVVRRRSMLLGGRWLCMHGGLRRRPVRLELGFRMRRCRLELLFLHVLRLMRLPFVGLRRPASG